MAGFNTWGPIDWWSYYKRPLDGPEFLRRMGVNPYPCSVCARNSACQKRVELGNTNQCKYIRRWMYDDYPRITNKIKAAHGDSSSEDGKR